MRDPRTTVTAVVPLDGYCLRVSFADGAVHELDLKGLLGQGGVFSRVRDDRALFEAVTVDAATATVAWPGDIDLDPVVLRGDHEPASGVPLARLVVQPA